MGRFQIRHPRLVLGALLVLAALAGVVGPTAPAHLSNKDVDFYSHESESFHTSYELERVRPKNWRGLPNFALIVNGRQAAFEAREELEELPPVAATENVIYSSRDERHYAVLAWLQKGLPEGLAAARVARAMEGPGVMAGGPALAGHQFSEQIKHDLHRAELVAFPLLLLLGLWVFRSAVSALLPVLVGGFALLCSLACIRAATELFPVSIFALNLAAGLALGLGVDYSLLMVSRFREELAAGAEAREAARRTVRSAGRTVLFSSAAIAAAFSSLLVFPIPFVRSIAFGGILVALLAGATALLMLPALFSLLGRRVDALAPKRWQRSVERTARGGHKGAWYRLAHFVMRRPVAVALASGAVLVALGLPSLSMRFTGFDITALPDSAGARIFTEEIRRDFEHPVVGEIQVAIHGGFKIANPIVARIEKLVKRDHLATIFPRGFKHSPRLWQVNLNPTHPVLSQETKRLVERLRGIKGVTVTGETAAYIDTAAALKHYLPYALLVLCLGSFLFIFSATGSVVLPVKALIMNVLSLGASCGLLVLVFQDGRLQGLLGYDSQHALVLALPIVMGAGAFGLLTDYGLFLLMRIKEARESGLVDREAIALGLERTGRTITAAALLFCVAVGSFATSGIVLVKEGALGIAFAVLLDAFVVRPLLVPSLMAILGKWNWWPRGVRLRGEAKPSEQFLQPRRP
ncbi:MAG: MMPL family transporter [Solirubrobacterales bacterium]